MRKTLDEYMAMPYRMEIVEDKEEGGYVASYPDLPGCITCGETVESVEANALDAKKSMDRGSIVFKINGKSLLTFTPRHSV